jgi:alpha-1,6-mannosyltransferase
MTLPIDSYFWQRLTWPEGASLIFNVVEGQSVQWGVSPLHPIGSISRIKLLIDLHIYMYSKTIPPPGSFPIQVMPWHFYFTSSLPKLLGITYPLALLGFVLNRKIFLLGACTLVFLVAMSCLGHKETRFIIYIVPVWNLATSVCVHRMLVHTKTNIHTQSFLTRPHFCRHAERTSSVLTLIGYSA